MIDFFKILGVSRDASSEEIKKSYQRNARMYHPDRNPGNDTSKAFHDIKEAYEVLSNPQKKAEYLNDMMYESTNDPKSVVTGIWEKLI